MANALSDSPAVPPCILFMDDETHVLQLCRIMLSSLGYDAVCVASGVDAERAVKGSLDSNPVVVAVLDINMPDGEGASEIGPRLKAISPQVRTVVSSGDRFDPTMLDPVAAGFHASLFKPYTRAELKECILRVLEM